jgi:phage FluMu protein Com
VTPLATDEGRRELRVTAKECAEHRPLAFFRVGMGWRCSKCDALFVWDEGAAWYGRGACPRCKVEPAVVKVLCPRCAVGVRPIDEEA